MKRKLMVWLAAAMLMVMAAGCGKNAAEPGGGTASSGSGSTAPAGGSTSTGGGSSTSGGGSTPTSQPAEKVNLGPLKVGDTAEVGPLTVTLSQINTVDQAPAPGYTYVLVEMSVTNNADAQYTVNLTGHYKLDTPEGKKAAYNLQATATRSPRLNGTLKKGDSATGWVGHLAKVVDGTYKYTFTHPDYGDATWEFEL